jgi:peptidoglycan hydrolase CwlO-like protein
MKTILITAALLFALNLAAQPAKNIKQDSIDQQFIRKGNKIFRIHEYQVDIESYTMELQMITEEIERLQRRRKEILNEINAIRKKLNND